MCWLHWERARYPDLGTALSDAKHISAYKKAFADLESFSMMPVILREPNYWLSCLLVDNLRDTLIKSLEAESIEARPIWKPLHLQPAFASCKVAVAHRPSNSLTGNLSPEWFGLT